ncbi:SURF1 family protein [Chromobacterium sp. IIBBL 290-4]|uniref:SURF1 family protein n=1 Tax=Chromobacterium sp. IIBBL 290-4 TaxID=2953890 RepID=UPI0020B7FED5|nr:SURF1 family protein [Chromobacterium sp. IIBBL 290-4]UTH76317.1 SURF1 family protein [Chromobacterium sp. IIBBL 290-4]
MTVSSDQDRKGGRRWQSLLWGLLLAISVIPYLLAVWQWQRGQDKEALLRSLASAMSIAPVPLVYREVEPPPEFTRVRLTQAAPAGRIIELRNSFLAGQSGRRILQPWRQGADQSLVLVDLGWLVDGVPAPAFRPDQLQLQGYRMPMPHHFLLSGATKGFEGPVDDVDEAALKRRYPGHWFQGLVVLETSHDPLVHWPVVPEFMPDRHYAYAIQWLLLGVCLSGLSWLLWRRRHEIH